MPSMSPGPAEFTLKLVRGQMRICPPRASFSVAGATPAESSEPEVTGIPDPVGWWAYMAVHYMEGQCIGRGFTRIVPVLV